ncbi:MAG: 2-hydroxyacyl-CoA dehydratase, partial [Desulfobacula sp.]|nr:2-hydroxyacyl-CoA dehydratase [Desulfobacula sp.]
QSAKTYMIDVLKKFKNELEAATGKRITDDDLRMSIGTFNKIRENLSEIYELQSLQPGIIKGADLYTLVKGSMIMDKNEAASYLSVIACALKKIKAPENPGKRIIISGSICDSPDIYTAIEEAGGVVVGDDLCTGQRWFDGRIEQKDTDPINAIADRLMTRVICPAKHSDPVTRGNNIVSLAKKNRADGVIFMLLKFCDPHAFDYPYLKDFLENNGIKTILIEIDDQQQSAGQLSTRLETFIHMI